MKERIEKGDLGPKKLGELPEDIAGRVSMLGELEKVVHRVMASMLAFELEIRMSITELEAGTSKQSTVQRQRPSTRLPAREVGRNRRPKGASVT